MSKLAQFVQILLLGAVLSVMPVPTPAAIIDINIDNDSSWGEWGDVNNTTLFIDIGEGKPVIIDGIAWDLSIASQGFSWLSEAVIEFGTSAGLGLIEVAPGVDDDFAGFASYTSGGILDLTDEGLNNMFLADGILRIQFFEDYDDIEQGADAFYNGFLRVSTRQSQAVPEPSMLPLFCMALLALLVISRIKSSRVS